MRTECQIESMLVRHVGDQLKRVYRTEDVLVDKGGEAAGRPVLRLQITHVLGVGGGAWSGPKAITVSAELVGNDGQVRQTKINRWSVGGMWGGFKGTCSPESSGTLMSPAAGMGAGTWGPTLGS